MTFAEVDRPRPSRDWPFSVTPLHPVLGCEITGITLEEEVSPRLFAKVYEAFLDYELITVMSICRRSRLRAISARCRCAGAGAGVI